MTKPKRTRAIGLAVALLTLGALAVVPHGRTVLRAGVPVAGPPLEGDA